MRNYPDLLFRSTMVIPLFRGAIGEFTCFKVLTSHWECCFRNTSKNSVRSLSAKENRKWHRFEINARKSTANDMYIDDILNYWMWFDLIELPKQAMIRGMESKNRITTPMNIGAIWISTILCPWISIVDRKNIYCETSAKMKEAIVMMT